MVPLTWSATRVLEEVFNLDPECSDDLLNHDARAKEFLHEDLRCLFEAINGVALEVAFLTRVIRVYVEHEVATDPLGAIDLTPDWVNCANERLRKHSGLMDSLRDLHSRDVTGDLDEPTYPPERANMGSGAGLIAISIVVAVITALAVFYNLTTL
jgi:hypothetical protein